MAAAEVEVMLRGASLRVTRQRRGVLSGSGDER